MTLKNTLNFAKRETLEDSIQVGLENELVTPMISTMLDKRTLDAGKDYTVPSVNDPMVEKYQFHGSLAGTPVNAKGNTITIDETPGAMFAVDKVEMKQLPGELGKKMARKLMYVTKNYIDQFTIATGVGGAGIDLGNVGAVNADQYADLFAQAAEELGWENGDGGQLFGLGNPTAHRMIQQNLITDGFREADNALRRGWRGQFGDFNFIKTNNLPVEAYLAIPVNPADGEIIKFANESIRFMDTPTQGGDVKREGTVAATRANLVALINKTGTGDGTDYIEFDTTDKDQLATRVKFNNMQLKIETFGATVADKALVTGFGRIRGDATGLAGAGNEFEQEYTYYLWGSKEGISSAVQMRPEIELRYPDNNKVTNYLCNALHGAAVLGNHAQKLVKAKVALV